MTRFKKVTSMRRGKKKNNQRQKKKKAEKQQTGITEECVKVSTFMYIYIKLTRKRSFTVFQQKPFHNFI